MTTSTDTTTVRAAHTPATVKAAVARFNAAKMGGYDDLRVTGNTLAGTALTLASENERLTNLLLSIDDEANRSREYTEHWMWMVDVRKLLAEGGFPRRTGPEGNLD